MTMREDDVEIGGTYESKGGRFYRVLSCSMGGHRLLVTQLNGTPEFETTLRRFASRMVRRSVGETEGNKEG